MEPCDLCGATTHEGHGFDACHDGHTGFTGYVDGWKCEGE